MRHARGRGGCRKIFREEEKSDFWWGRKKSHNEDSPEKGKGRP